MQFVIKELDWIYYKALIKNGINGYKDIFLEVNNQKEYGSMNRLIKFKFRKEKLTFKWL